MGTLAAYGSLDLNVAVLASPMGLGGSCLSFEGQRSIGPAKFGTFGYLGPLSKLERPRIEATKFTGDNRVKRVDKDKPLRILLKDK